MSEEPEESTSEQSEEAPLSRLRERLEARSAEEGDIDEDAPLSELARDAQASDETERSELFEEVDVGEIDAEAVWEAITEEGQSPEEVLGEATEPSAAEPTSAPDEHVIDKREYCQRCEYFSEPPAAACGHEGTEIVELVDSDSFRVRNCPKVGEDEEALRSMIGDDEQP